MAYFWSALFCNLTYMYYIETNDTQKAPEKRSNTIFNSNLSPFSLTMNIIEPENICEQCCRTIENYHKIITLFYFVSFFLYVNVSFHVTTDKEYQ